MVYSGNPSKKYHHWLRKISYLGLFNKAQSAMFYLFQRDSNEVAQCVEVTLIQYLSKALQQIFMLFVRI